MLRTCAVSALISLAGASVVAADGPKSAHTKVVVYEPGDAAGEPGSPDQAEIAVQGQGNTGAVRRRFKGKTLEAGVISRQALTNQLSLGIGHFLGQVRVRAVVAGGRFVGWKLVSFGSHANQKGRGGLKPGDIVLRANGQSLERPDQFKLVWDSLASASMLVLDVKREGKWLKLQYRIQ